MKVSVLIAAYNAAATIRATLDSVLAQSVSPSEIIVLDDGSTDDTFSAAESYKPRVAVLRQSNGGVARARNVLCARASGDLVAYIDADDIWHPKYLEVQCKLFEEHPAAVGFFTGHANFRGYGPFDWSTVATDTQYEAEVIDPLNFLRRYNRETGMFASMSYLCVPRKVFAELGGEPFCERVPGVEDSFLCTVFPLIGPIVFFPAPLVAYRITGHSLSVLRLERFAMWVEVFDILKARYENQPNQQLIEAFRSAYASKRRAYAKVLMGAAEAKQARAEILRSVGDCATLPSVAKSITLLALTHMPRVAQPKWPSRYRD